MDSSTAFVHGHQPWFNHCNPSRFCLDKETWELENTGVGYLHGMARTPRKEMV